MTGPFDSARGKLRRALRHLDELDGMIDLFVDDHVHPLPVETNSDRSEQVWKVHIDREPPDDLALVFGDALFNLRAALDHFAYALAVPPKKGKKRTEFPIFDDPARFWERYKTTRHFTRQSGPAKLQGINKAQRKTIELLQPYHGSRGSGFRRQATRYGLGRIHDLNIWDKHNALHVIVHGADMGSIGTPPSLTFDFIPTGIRVGETEVFRVRWPNADPEDYPDPSFAVDVAIGDAASDFLGYIIRFGYGAVRDAMWQVARVDVPPAPRWEPRIIDWRWHYEGSLWREERSRK